MNNEYGEMMAYAIDRLTDAVLVLAATVKAADLTTNISAESALSDVIALWRKAQGGIDTSNADTLKQARPDRETEIEAGKRWESVEYTRSGVPKVCPECGHAFHPAGKCQHEWREYGVPNPTEQRCMCQRNMAIELPI